jgi:hypothetical protein
MDFIIKRLMNCLSLIGAFVIVFSIPVNTSKDLWSYLAWQTKDLGYPFIWLYYSLHSYHGFNFIVDTTKLIILIVVPILTINYICFNKITFWHKNKPTL